MPAEVKKKEEEKQYSLGEDPAFKELKQLVVGTVSLVRQLGVTQQQQAQLIGNIGKPATKGKGKKEDDLEDDDDGDGDDLDGLTPKQLNTFLMKNVGKLLDEKLGAMKTNMDGVVSKMTAKELQAEYNTLSGKYKDFKDWGEEMQTLAKAHPTLGLKDLYKLAREENEEKVKELTAKYVDKDGKKEPDESLTLFGGYRPSSKTSAGDDKEEKKMTVEQAADVAWDEMVGKFPALGKMGDTLD